MPAQHGFRLEDTDDTPERVSLPKMNLNPKKAEILAGI
jgi:hypothetical protein